MSTKNDKITHDLLTIQELAWRNGSADQLDAANDMLLREVQRGSVPPTVAAEVGALSLEAALEVQREAFILHDGQLLDVANQAIIAKIHQSQTPRPQEVNSV